VSRLEGAAALSCEADDALRCLIGAHDALSLLPEQHTPLLPPSLITPLLPAHNDDDDDAGSDEADRELVPRSDGDWWQRSRGRLALALLLAAVVSAVLTVIAIVLLLQLLFLSYQT
jgi:hypothetical protein